MEVEDISSLSNQELRRKLIEHGFNPGPVLSTTRGVYEEKLKSALLEKFNQNKRTPIMVTRKSPRKRTPAEPLSADRKILPPPRMAPLDIESDEEIEDELFEGEESFRAVSDSETESQRASPVSQMFKPASEHTSTPYPSPSMVSDYRSQKVPTMDAYERRPVKNVYSYAEKAPPRHESLLVKWATRCSLFVLFCMFVYMLLQRLGDLRRNSIPLAKLQAASSSEESRSRLV
ncbi:LEM domain protein [Trichuris suis]|nr:LEM domain protein [Trichuris suis]